MQTVPSTLAFILSFTKSTGGVLAQLARQVCCLRDLDVCGCAVRQFFSFDLKAAAERSDYSEYPTSLAENKEKILDWNQVVIPEPLQFNHAVHYNNN